MQWLPLCFCCDFVCSREKLSVGLVLTSKTMNIDPTPARVGRARGGAQGEGRGGSRRPREELQTLDVCSRSPSNHVPSSLQPTSAGLQKRTPTLQRSICTPTSLLSRAVHRRFPLSPPTASVLTSAPRTRMLGGSLCGRNWTRTEGAGQTRLLPGSRHPPPHGR